MTNRLLIAAALAMILIGGAMTSGCATTYAGYQGGAVGAGVGAVAGALIDAGNPWRGGAIGAGLGAILGSAMGDISANASRNNYNHRPSYGPPAYNRPPAYRPPAYNPGSYRPQGPQYGYYVY